MGVRQKFKADERRNAVFVKNYSRKFNKLRNETMKVVIENMEGSIETIAQNAANLVNEDYLPRFYTDLYRGVGSYWARRQYNELLGLKQDIQDAVWQLQLEQWVASNVGYRIVSVQGTLKKWVAETVQMFVNQALEEGIPIERLTQEARKYLENQYTGYSHWKTRQIVSNEVLTSYSVSNEIGAKSTGLQNIQKTWIHSGSKDPHILHVALNGKTIPMEQDFDIGGQPAKYPRDSRLTADQSVNCLCAVAYRAVR